MTLAIIGLGLIGGSLAKAYKKAGHTVLGFDKSETVLDFALISNIIDGRVTDENIATCDLILIAVYPEAVIEYLKEKSLLFSKDTIVIDCGGTKRDICKTGFSLAEKHGFTFIGGHPMAGSHKSGLKNSRDNLFSNAPMVIVPPRFDDMALLDKVKQLLSPAGFGKISVTTADEHDELIAFTSQMAHVVSNAFIKSPTASSHKGFSAGSYKDLTRVANLNADMWSELFLENKDNLIKELDIFLTEVSKYKEALEEENREELTRLLLEGTLRKKEVDKR